MTASTSRNTVRSYYDGDVDFDDLAAKDPDFAAIRKAAKDKRWVDFQNPQVVQQLTKSLLKCDFGLTIQLPDDRLCPPVPVRWNYIRWIQELLDTTTEDYGDRYDPDREVIGLDIGVGASCIYPLLACASRASWRMAGTDIDQHSLAYARQNVDGNNTNKRVKLALSTPDSPLIPLDAMKIEELDFVMTNPPFYDSEQDMQSSYINKSAPPSAVCTGAENEMICPGGDFGFVSRIFDESVKLRERVQWYTAMLGKMSSLQQMISKLKEANVNNFAVTSLQAGFKTRRWAVAWSFRGYRPRNDVARHGDLVLAVLPSPTAQTIRVPMMSAENVGEKVDGLMRDLDVKWHWKAGVIMGVMEARENVWSRAARRKKKVAGFTDGTGAKDAKMANDSGDEDEIVRLAVKIACKKEEVELRWLRGDDYVLFESFSGLLKRAFNTRT